MPSPPAGSRLRAVVKAAWWIVLLRGVLAIVLGLYAVSRPLLTVVLLVQVMAAYWLVDGLFMLLAAVTGRTGDARWWVVLLRALIGIAAGLLVWGSPLVAAALTGTVLLYVLALQAIVTGVIEIATAVRVRREVEGEWSLILAGVLSILFGVLVFAAPSAMGVALVRLLGVLGIAGGVILVALAFRLRRLVRA